MPTTTDDDLPTTGDTVQMATGSTHEVLATDVTDDAWVRGDHRTWDGVIVAAPDHPDGQKFVPYKRFRIGHYETLA